MATERFPSGSTFRWAMARTHDRMTSLVIGGLVVGVVAGIAIGLFNPGSSASNRVQAEHGGIGALLGFAAVVLLAAFYSIIRAPFEQRKILASILTDSEMNEQTLLAASKEPLLRKKHREELRSMASSALMFVDAGLGVSFDPRDLTCMTSHFQELAPLIEEWNAGVVEWRQRNEALEERFEMALHEESLDIPPWSTRAFKIHFLQVKRRARDGNLGNPYKLSWHDPVDDLPNMIWFGDGTALVKADPESESLNREACMRRAQDFVDQMLTWDETTSYGDWQAHHKFESVRGRLQAALKLRVDMHDYKRGDGCPRCPQL